MILDGDCRTDRRYLGHSAHSTACRAAWLCAPGFLNLVQPPQVAPASRSKLAPNPRSVSPAAPAPPPPPAVDSASMAGMPGSQRRRRVRTRDRSTPGCRSTWSPFGPTAVRPPFGPPGRLKPGHSARRSTDRLAPNSLGGWAGKPSGLRPGVEGGYAPRYQNPWMQGTSLRNARSTESTEKTCPSSIKNSPSSS